MIAGTYLEEMLKRRRARQLAEAIEQGFKQGFEESFKQGFEETFEQGVAQGRAELIAEIREWNARRLDAGAKGEPFDEPPPGMDG